MGEYARINEGFAYWHRYATEMQAVDASLVTPVLESLGASIGCKWLSDSNACRCRIQGKELEIVCDVRDEVSGIVEVTVNRLQGDRRTKVGDLFVQLPCENWGAPQEQLRALL